MSVVGYGKVVWKDFSVFERACVRAIPRWMGRIAVGRLHNERLTERG
jgi:hypothetical protein